MTTKTVLSNDALQYLSGQVASRFRLFYAVHNPINFTVISQDIQTNQFGQPDVTANVDLLAQRRAPYAPQPNFGPNRIGFVNEPLYFDGSRSSQRGNLPATQHVWSCSGVAAGFASISAWNTTIAPTQTNASQGAQVAITFNKPGQYTVSLTVTDRFGSITQGTRQVMVYQDRESAPQGAYQLNSLTGTLDAGGWSASLTTARHNALIAAPSALNSGTFQPITILAETYYEVEPGVWLPLTLGQYGSVVPGQFYDDPRILFSGYISHGTAEEDAEKDTVTYQLSTVDMILKQAGIHNIGYYHATYGTRANDGTPTSLTPIDGQGQGQMVADLTSEDIYRSLLLDHCTVGQYHDIVLWRDFLPDPAVSPTTRYWLTYSNLTANEGTIWDACGLMAQNEFASVWAERNGCVCIGPLYTMRGYELLTLPTNYGFTPLSQILNLSTELNNDTIQANRAGYLLFQFGPNPLPVALDTQYGTPRDLSSLVGPPVVAEVSDVPIYDTANTPPPGLFPWTVGGWPQDISVRPIKTTVDVNYTSRSTFVKEVATLATSQNVWSAYYPIAIGGSNLFDSTGLMTQRVNAGTWTVETNLLLADITAQSQKALSWQYLWEMTRRRFFALNALYSVTVEAGMWTFSRLHDLINITRQRVQDGPKFSSKPFYVSGITFTIDLDNQTWQTELVTNEVTSFGLGPMITPPTSAPDA